MTSNRIPRGVVSRVLSMVGGPVRWRLAKWGAIVEQVNMVESSLAGDTNQELRKRSLSLRYRVKSGERLARLMPEAFALVREAARRTLSMRHFDVQILGGIALFHGAIAEMETGEGKTLTATLPLYLHALAGKGAHLATVNDYLAARDADWMRPVYELLGLTVGVIQHDLTHDQRRAAYACDITYGTAKEIGFDFLRDRLTLRRLGYRHEDSLGGNRRIEGSEQPLQRGMHFALVDEADCILIDDARTPLIIGIHMPSVDDSQMTLKQKEVYASYHWASRAAARFVEDEHYEVDDETKKVELTAEGRQLVRTTPKPHILRGVGLVDLYEYTERAIKVDRDYQLDRQYVIRDGEIVIVDEFTGRLGEGRRWQHGIHEAVEARHDLLEKGASDGIGGAAARITIQDLFMRYSQLAGMTGTARTSAREFYKIYRARVIPVPTNRPVRRKRLSDRVFANIQEKWQAVMEEVRELHQQGRPILIGTRSIDKSVLLSKVLHEVGIEHEVLNAREIAREAEIVARAGERGKVTVATNMAGRGTDIKLGPGVAELGGLHVVCTELHDAARIDRQLAGRCARQGDPGTYRQYLALDDEILSSAFGLERAKKIELKGAKGGRFDQYNRLLRRAQRKVDRQHLRDRMALMHHEKDRKKSQREMGQDPYLDTAD